MLHIDTPLLESRALSSLTQRSVWLKMDALQPSGSFKIRGVGATCEHYARAGKQRFVSSSGGNAGIAVAYAGRQLSIPVSVYVPETTSETAKSLIRQQGAELTVHGSSWQDANERALQAVDAAAAFIHPFDDSLLWSGHATLVDEIVKGNGRFDAIVLSVGGGGLLCGVAEGLARNGLGELPIIAVETEGADSLDAAIAAGHPVELPAITSVATSLGAKRVCQAAFDLASTRPVHSVVVSDREAVDGCLRFLEDHRVVVEPACGAALAVAYMNHDALSHFGRILIVVCGGSTSTVDQLRHWADKLFRD